jgi:hypothetical protein
MREHEQDDDDKRHTQQPQNDRHDLFPSCFPSVLKQLGNGIVPACIKVGAHRRKYPLPLGASSKAP